MKIAVVIPALDEAAGIAGAVESASVAEVAAGSSADPERRLESQTRRFERQSDSGGQPSEVVVEVVVVDGGSRDATTALAREAGARVVSAPAGRARQLQAGVEASTGEVVLFLHADTRLALGWQDAVRGALSRSDVVGGAFRLRLDAQGAALRLVEWGAHVRVALFGMPFGDQAIFVRRDVLEAIGGVPDAPVMEDVDLVTAMKRRGRVASVALPARTSARRYVANGVAKTVALHFFALLCRGFGVDRARIARWLGR